MQSKIKTTVLFGLLLAVLAVILEFFEYRYFIGSLNTTIYTSLVATVFTAVGIWIGINLLRKKIPGNEPSIDRSKIEALNLKEREYEVLELIAKGLSNQKIADHLFLALPTVKTHLSNLYSKMDVQSRTQAIHKARSLKLIAP